MTSLLTMRTFATVIAAIIFAALPATAQKRGTMEFGGFASAAAFDNELTLDRGFGGGARIGMFLLPRLSIEFEQSWLRSSRTLGLRDVNMGIIATRLVGVPYARGPLSVVAGAGAGVSTESNFLHSRGGVDVLAGAKYSLDDRFALRLDGVVDWLADQDWKSYRSVRLGLTVYRHP